MPPRPDRRPRVARRERAVGPPGVVPDLDRLVGVSGRDPGESGAHGDDGLGPGGSLCRDRSRPMLAGGHGAWGSGKGATVQHVVNPRTTSWRSLLPALLEAF